MEINPYRLIKETATRIQNYLNRKREDRVLARYFTNLDRIAQDSFGGCLPREKDVRFTLYPPTTLIDCCA